LPAIDQLRADLPETVAHEVVAIADLDEMAAGPDQLHAAFERLREIEDMLERAAVEDEVVFGAQRIRQRLVEVVLDRRALERRIIERVDPLGAEHFEKAFGERPVGSDLGRRRAAVDGGDAGHQAGAGPEPLATDHQRRGEIGASGLRAAKRLSGGVIKSHALVVREVGTKGKRLRTRSGSASPASWQIDLRLTCTGFI
jgi:hypothetical protein